MILRANQLLENSCIDDRIFHTAYGANMTMKSDRE
jgi:hypothetical protein